MTKLFITVSDGDQNIYPQLKESKYILGSYFYWKNNNIKKIYSSSEIILDSGVFTMFGKNRMSKKQIEKYTDNYIEYIIKNNIKNFVEMDLDSLYPYSYVKFLRNKIEKGVKKKCIPIWHSSRGKNEFLEMCEKYPYSGIGGMVINEPIKQYKHLFPDLNKFAKAKGSKLHCMGFTPTKNLHKFGFYSSDSTSWSTGGRYGQIYYFKNNQLIIKSKPKNTRIKNYKELNKFNLKQRLKYQNYCDKFNL